MEALSLEGDQDGAGSGAPALWGEAGASSAWSRDGFAGGPNSSPQCLWGHLQGGGAGLFTAVQGRKVRDNRHKLKQKFRLDVRRNFFLWLPENILLVTLVAQRGCAVSVLGSFRTVTGRSPGQLGLTSELTLVWAGGRTRDLLTCLPDWTMLWSFFDNYGYEKDICSHDIRSPGTAGVFGKL